MIEHLRQREKALEQFGSRWCVCTVASSRGRSSVTTSIRIASVRCALSRHWWRGVRRWRAKPWCSPGGGKPCRISSKPIYRALGAEHIRHRRKAHRDVMMRRRLSLDFVLEHPGMPWLPTEPEKVEFFEEIGLDRRLIPRRLYHGTVGNRQRYLALKMPVAGDTESVTFVYADPGRETDSELRSWGVAHGPLWVALRKKGRQVRVIGIAAENEALDRAYRVLQVWAAPARWKPGEGVDGEAGNEAH